MSVSKEYKMILILFCVILVNSILQSQTAFVYPELLGKIINIVASTAFLVLTIIRYVKVKKKQSYSLYAFFAVCFGVKIYQEFGNIPTDYITLVNIISMALLYGFYIYAQTITYGKPNKRSLLIMCSSFALYIGGVFFKSPVFVILMMLLEVVILMFVFDPLMKNMADKRKLKREKSGIKEATGMEKILFGKGGTAQYSKMINDLQVQMKTSKKYEGEKT